MEKKTKKAKTFWCDYGCGKKISLFSFDYVIHKGIYKCKGCNRLFEKISKAYIKPIEFKEKKRI